MWADGADKRWPHPLHLRAGTLQQQRGGDRLWAGQSEVWWGIQGTLWPGAQGTAASVQMEHTCHGSGTCEMVNSCLGFFDVFITHFKPSMVKKYFTHKMAPDGIFSVASLEDILLSFCSTLGNSSTPPISSVIRTVQAQLRSMNVLHATTTQARRSLRWWRSSPWSRVFRFWWVGWRAFLTRPSDTPSTPPCRISHRWSWESRSDRRYARRRMSLLGNVEGEFCMGWI